MSWANPCFPALGFESATEQRGARQSLRLLFDGDAFGEVSGLIDVATQFHRDVVSEYLEND